MIRYEFLHHPDPGQLAQILRLYHNQGWWTDADPDAAAEASIAEVLAGQALVARIVAGSHCFLAAMTADGAIIGMGRAISDGASDAYIQDVTVDAARRGQGIGSAIIQRLAQRLSRDGIGWIGLIAEADSHPFYTRLGFSPMKNAVPMRKETS